MVIAPMIVDGPMTGSTIAILVVLAGIESYMIRHGFDAATPLIGAVTPPQPDPE